MFFEVLVLATKDAVKVSQRDGFGDIHVGPKKALWGSWAEELDEQQQEERKERELDQQEKEKEEELASRRKQEQRVSGAGGRRDVVVGTGRNGAAEVASAA